MKERHVKPGEMLAMDPSRIRRGPGGDFFWMLGSSTTPNERRGDVTIVQIRGELEHHEADAFGGESYEGILERVRTAMTGEDCDDAAADEEPVATTPPTAVLLVIDSPGGVVAGLNECVASLQKMKAQFKIPIYAYVNEMAASAAYAIACAADEIYCPPSAIVGSIGVISTMVSQARKNEKDGYDVRLLTSGARKADGHLHAPISDAALKVEMGRVNKLALAFFKIASKARKVPVETIQSYEAGIFLGPDAVKRGLADGVLSFEDFLSGATDETPAAQAGGNQTDRRVDTQTKSENTMPVMLAALIKKTKAKIAAAIAADADPEKLSALYADLAAYKKTKKHVEHTETEEGADGDDEGEGGDDDKDEDDDKDSDKSEKKSEEKSEEKFPDKGKGDEDDDEEEDEEEEESSAESEEKDAKAALALITTMTGMRGKKAIGGARALFATALNAAKDVALMKKQSASREKKDLIASARGKYITRFDAEWLQTQPLAVVKGFVETRRKQGVIVNTDDTTLLKPKQSTPGTEESLPADTIAMIDSATASFPGSKAEKDAFRATLVTAQLKTHTETVAKALNGQGRI